MAVAYAAIANGGTVVRPHLAESVEDPAGAPVSEFEPAARRQLDISDESREAILAGMHDAATGAGGTSVEVFGGFPVEVAGKTGTAERPPNGHQSWYASVAPYPDPEIVVVTTVENGGFGAETAAPVARAIYAAYFGVSESETTSTETTEVAPPTESTETVVPAG